MQIQNMFKSHFQHANLQDELLWLKTLLEETKQQIQQSLSKGLKKKSCNLKLKFPCWKEEKSNEIICFQKKSLLVMKLLSLSLDQVIHLQQSLWMIDWSWTNVSNILELYFEMLKEKEVRLLALELLKVILGLRGHKLVKWRKRLEDCNLRLNRGIMKFRFLYNILKSEELENQQELLISSKQLALLRNVNIIQKTPYTQKCLAVQHEKSEVNFKNQVLILLLKNQPWI